MIGDNSWKMSLKLRKSNGSSYCIRTQNEKGPDFGPGWDHIWILNLRWVGRVSFSRGWTW
jgi:hypothetical protein